MEIVAVVSRIVHVATAIVLVGGSSFMLMVLMPAAKQIPEDVHATLRDAITGRWKKFVHIGVLLFLITGFYNYLRAIPLHKGDGLYHILIGTKVLLAFGVFFLAAALVGRSPGLQKIRDNRAKWLRVLVLLAAVIVGLAGYAKVRPAPIQDTASTVYTSRAVDTTP
ncbi:MAG: hypothetical protein AAF989_03560 [Planctomycetota bacterium]